MSKSKDSPLRIRTRVDTTDRFPEKVYDVANSGKLIKWNGTGTAIAVNDMEFEANVMQMYPGFVQISSFVNLRRLFREYAYDWKILERLEDGSTVFEFSHPSFLHGKRDLCAGVLTRRKSFSRPSRQMSKFHEDVLKILDGDDGSYSTRTKRGRYKLKQRPYPNDFKKYIEYPNVNISDEDSNSGHSGRDTCRSSVQTNQNLNACDCTSFNDCGDHSMDCDHRTHPVFSEQAAGENSAILRAEIMRLFFQNEFTFEDFCQWVERNTKVFESNSTTETSANTNEVAAKDGTKGAKARSPCMQCSCCAYFTFEENEEHDSCEEAETSHFLDTESTSGDPEIIIHL